MCDRRDDFPVLHDLYLTLLDLSAQFDEILFDEAQAASSLFPMEA